MREILFRGKRVNDREWVYGCLLNNKHDMIGFYNNAYKFEINVVIPETVGQFTSLIDKNGNKIFEGDIVSAITLDTGDEQRAVVCFGNFIDENTDDEYIGFFIEFDGIKTTITQLSMEECKNRIEVIGNIHDNPELLEGVE